MIRLLRRPEWILVNGSGDWWVKAFAGYVAPAVTVHPFYRPDGLVPGTETGWRLPGENRTRHSTTLGAAVGEMVEALG